MNKNELLYGRGTTENIVATEVVSGKENIMEVFYRKDGEVISEYIPYKPFVYVNESDSVLDKLYEDTTVRKLLGSNYYNRLIESDNFSYINWIAKEADDSEQPFTQSQWMIQSGQTQYKGMSFDDPLRLYCDIEVLTKEGYEFPNSSRAEDKIMIISMLTNRGDKYILALNEDNKTPKAENVYRCSSEEILLQKWVKSIRKIDPDIILGHNFFGFDLPYIRDRAQLHGVELQIGRNGDTPRTFSTSIKFAEKSDDYENFQIYGRHVLDTMFMAKAFDVVARELNSVGLKQCAQYLGVTPEGRTYVKGEDITKVWFEDRKKLLDYALDDVIETRGLDKEWGRGIFESTKLFPLPMQDTARYGTGNKFDLLMERQYYKYDGSLPKPDERQDYGGGYAQTFEYGFFGEDSIYADISSLYPSLRYILGVTTSKDFLGIYPELCELLKEFRYKTKYQAVEEREKGNDKLADQLEAQDGQFKILLNTGSYGWLSWQWGKFNDYSGAETITLWGRKVIKKVNEGLEKFGGSVKKCDTDGSLVVVPETYRGDKDSETIYIKKVEQYVNDWLHSQVETDQDIVLEHDGRYKKCILFDDKSYVLQTHDGETKIKGNTLTGRSNEQFMIRFINDSINHILDEQPDKIREEYQYWKSRIENKLMSVDQVKKRQSLNMSLEEYKNKKASDSYSPIAQYEAALQADRPYMKGDVIETWNEEPSPKIRTYKTKPDKEYIPSAASYEVIRLAKNYNGNIYRDHYLDRLNKGAKKFLVVLGWDKFQELFGDEIRLNKPSRAKMIGVWGLEKFMGEFPDFNWRVKDRNKLSEQEKQTFDELVGKEKVNINKKLKEYYDT